MFLHVTAVKYVKDYVLQVTFNNGRIKQVNLQNELDGEVFEPLRNPAVFQQVAVNPDTKTIEWPNGADMAPEFLNEIGQMKPEYDDVCISSPAMQPVPA